MNPLFPLRSGSSGHSLLTLLLCLNGASACATTQSASGSGLGDATQRSVRSTGEPTLSTVSRRRVVDFVAEPGAAPAATTADASPTETTDAVAAADEATPAALPRTCQEGDAGEAHPQALSDGCYPEEGFVQRLCSGAHPSSALVLFSKESPWVRAYMKGPAKAWTTAPGSQNEEQLAFREELLVLQGPETSDGAVETSQGASFYALRWDGTCVKVNEEEVTLSPPWQKATPPLRWEWLDDGQQKLLRQDATISKLVPRLRADCRGGRFSKSSAKCAQARAQITEAIVAFVRSGGDLPDPEALP